MTSPLAPATASAEVISAHGAAKLQVPPLPVRETKATVPALADVAAAARARTQIPPMMELATGCLFMAFASVSRAASCGCTHEASTEAQTRPDCYIPRLLKLRESLRGDA